MLMFIKQEAERLDSLRNPFAFVTANGIDQLPSSLDNFWRNMNNYDFERFVNFPLTWVIYHFIRPRDRERHDQIVVNPQMRDYILKTAVPEHVPHQEQVARTLHPDDEPASEERETPAGPGTAPASSSDQHGQAPICQPPQVWWV